MGTHACIAMKTDNGCKAIYVHYDGYPSHTLKILEDFYNTQEQVEKLIALGDCSYIAQSCDAPEGHTFSSPVKGYCVAYGRDRGEKDTEAREVSFSRLQNEFGHVSYTYVWNGGEWNQLADLEDYI